MFILKISEEFRVLKESKPVDAFMGLMEQMGIAFGSENKQTNDPSTESASAISLADININQGNFGFKSNNASKLQEILNVASGTVDNGAIICFKVGDDNPFYADFSNGKGSSLIFLVSYTLLANLKNSMLYCVFYFKVKFMKICVPETSA